MSSITLIYGQILYMARYDINVNNAAYNVFISMNTVQWQIQDFL